MRIPRRGGGAALIALIAFGLAGCDRGPRARPPTPVAPLYERLGGIAALRALVDELGGRLAADPALRATYQATDFRVYKRRLLAELCGATGGPCRATATAAAPASPAVATAWLAHLDAAARSAGLADGPRAELARRVSDRAGALAVELAGDGGGPP